MSEKTQTVLPYRLIRSKRRTLSLHIDDNCEIVVRAPLKLPKKTVDAFVAEHADWIEKHMPAARARQAQHDFLTPERLDALKARAREVIPPRVAYYAARMGVEPTGVKITTARKRFGSCSAKNSLCFSCLLMLYPDEAVDCVVVHELAHIRHHDHSPAFYAFIDRFMPDYRAREHLLRTPPKMDEAAVFHNLVTKS